MTSKALPKALPDYDFRANEPAAADGKDKDSSSNNNSKAAPDSQAQSGSTPAASSADPSLPAFDDPLPERSSDMNKENLVAPDDASVTLQRLAQGAGEAVGVGPGSVSVCYLARFLASGLVFDNGHESVPITLDLTEPGTPSGMLPAWDIALPALHVGDVALLTVNNPKWAYGEQGMGDLIPPNAALQFRLTVVAVARPPPPARQASSSKERLDAAEAAKTTGNASITSNPTDALAAYADGLAWLSDLLIPGSSSPDDPTLVLANAEEEARAKTLTIALQANTAAAKLNLKDGPGAVEAAEAALALDPKHVKAQFRLAQALRMTGDFSRARSAIVAAIKLSPNDKRLRTTLDEIKAIQARRAKSALAMFSDPDEPAAPAAPAASSSSTVNVEDLLNSVPSAAAPPADTSAVSEDDVNVVASQVPDTVSRDDIRASLAKHDGDLINAIMELSG